MRLIRSIAAAGVALLALAFVSPSPQAYAASPLVVIDPGHGGSYSNANANGLREKNVNLAIALELRRQLISRGYRVAMTRTTDRALTYRDIATWNWSSRTSVWSYAPDGRGGIFGGIPKDDLQARVDYANRLGAELFVSIHNNGAANRSARGTETFASPRDRLGRSLARIVQSRVVARTGLRNRGVGTTDFYVLRWSNMPAILVEGAFISNRGDAYLLRQSRVRRNLAIGIAEGVDRWFDSGAISKTARPIVASSASSASIAIARRSFPTTAPAVVIAREDLWSDAVAAPALAARLSAPLLWTAEGTVPTETLTEVARLTPHQVFVVGVDGSYDATALAALARAASMESSAITVLGGADGSAVTAAGARVIGPSQNGHVLVVDEADTAGLLAAASVAARRRMPLLFARDGQLTADSAAFLAENTAWVTTLALVGTPSRVPPEIGVGFITKRFDVPDQSALAAALNAYYCRTWGTGSLRAVVADSRYEAAYLSAASYAANTWRVLVPAQGAVLPTPSRLWITNRRAQIASFEVCDTVRSIPPILEHELRKADM